MEVGCGEQSSLLLITRLRCEVDDEIRKSGSRDMAMRTARYDKVVCEIWQSGPRDMAKQPANWGETVGLIR